jgi:GNAT superfamily N-acetyltransferase
MAWILNSTRTILSISIGAFFYPFLPRIAERNALGYKIVGYRGRHYRDVLTFTEAWPEGHFGRAYRINLKLYGRKTCFLLLNKSDRIIGVVFFYFRWQDLPQHSIHSAYGVVLPEFRGSGLGALLFDTAWRSFDSQVWIHGITANYDCSNIDSAQLHRRCGFVSTGIWEGPDGMRESVFRARRG